MTINQIFYRALLLISLSLPLIPAFAADTYKIYLTAEENQGVPLNEPTDDFSCSDKIFAVLDVKDPELDDSNTTQKHTLEALWRDPNGEDREHTEYEFNVVNGQARVWVWLKLSRSAEAALVQFVNPSAGMDAFIGTWELRLFIDGEQIDKRNFEVLC